MKKEIVEELNDAIKIVNEIHGAFDDSHPEYGCLLKLRDIWESDDTEFINFEVTKFFHERSTKLVEDIKENTTKAIEKNHLLHHEWSSSMSNISDPNRPIKKYQNKSIRKKAVDEYAKQFKDCTKPQLLGMIADLLVQQEIDSDWSLVDMKEASYLREKFLDSLEKRLTKGKNTSISLKDRYKENDDALNKIYDLVLADVLQNGKDIPTYRQFQLKVDQNKLKPAFIKTPRISPDEKMMLPEDLDFVIKQKTRDYFAPTTLRKFYEERSGQPATTKKSVIT